jgi:hypothetical protein
MSESLRPYGAMGFFGYGQNMGFCPVLFCVVILIAPLLAADKI